MASPPLADFERNIRCANAPCRNRNMIVSCRSCRTRPYCSVQCQLAHWSKHACGSRGHLPLERIGAWLRTHLDDDACGSPVFSRYSYAGFRGSDCLLLNVSYGSQPALLRIAYCRKSTTAAMVAALEEPLTLSRLYDATRERPSAPAHDVANARVSPVIALHMHWSATASVQQIVSMLPCEPVAKAGILVALQNGGFDATTPTALSCMLIEYTRFSLADAWGPETTDEQRNNLYAHAIGCVLALGPAKRTHGNLGAANLRIIDDTRLAAIAYSVDPAHPEYFRLPLISAAGAMRARVVIDGFSATHGDYNPGYDLWIMAADIILRTPAHRCPPSIVQHMIPAAWQIYTDGPNCVAAICLAREAADSNGDLLAWGRARRALLENRVIWTRMLPASCYRNPLESMALAGGVCVSGPVEPNVALVVTDFSHAQ